MRILLLPLVLSFPSFAVAGEEQSLSHKLFQAEQVVEVRMPVAGTVPESWPNKVYDPQGWAFPDSLASEARGKVELARVVVAPPGGEQTNLPASLHLFASDSRCWWAAHARGEVRALVFLERQGEAARQVFGVELERGAYSDFNPHYDDLVAAVQRAAAWTDERTRAVAAGALWQDQRQALVSANAHERMLARDFLLAHDGATVLDEVWGAAGTPERASNEAAARWPDDASGCEAASD